MQPPVQTNKSFILVLTCLCLGVGYWSATKFSPCIGSGARTSIKSDPTINAVERMTDVVALKVHVSDILHSSKEDGRFTYIKGAWIVKGDALISVAMEKTHYDSIDYTNKVAEITLPPPSVVSPRVDHDKTREFDFKSGLFVSAKAEVEARQEAMCEAQRLILHAAQASENIELARHRTEFLIHELFREFGWKIKVNWVDRSKTNAPVLKG